jgi:hypothetical protein
MDCNHYVFNKNARNGNCHYGLSTGFNRFRCGILESCYDLMPSNDSFLLLLSNGY